MCSAARAAPPRRSSRRLPQRNERDQPVERPAFQVVEAQRLDTQLAIVPLPEAEGRRWR